jgi:hypothetical protein
MGRSSEFSQTLIRRVMADVFGCSVMSFVGHEYPKSRDGYDANGSRNVDGDLEFED